MQLGRQDRNLAPPVARSGGKICGLVVFFWAPGELWREFHEILLLSPSLFLCEPTGRDSLLPESAQGQLDRCTFFSLILLSFPNLDFGGDIPLLLLNLPNFELNTIICVL